MNQYSLSPDLAARLLKAALELCRTCGGSLRILQHIEGSQGIITPCPDCRDAEGNPTGKRLPLVLERCNFGHNQLDQCRLHNTQHCTWCHNTCFNLAQHNLLSRIIDQAERLGVRECVLNTNYPDMDYYARLGDSEANSTTRLDAAAEALLTVVEGV